MVSHTNSSCPARRVIVLGASNVTRGLRVVYRTAARIWGGSLDLLAAIGHGRSYGRPSSVLGRTLPSIRGCELWGTWQACPALPTAALITDIGNDILYGASPSQIADWVRECVDRLIPGCDRIVITGLPWETVTRVGPARFRILQTLLFPRSELTREQVIAHALELQERIAAIATSYRLGWRMPDQRWYGFDPIHIRRRYWDAAWQQILAPWGCGDDGPADPIASPTNWTTIRLRPQQRWVFGKLQRTEQPAWRGPDGSCLSLY